MRMRAHSLFVRVRRAERAVKTLDMAARASDLEVCCWAYEGQTGRLRAALEEEEKLLRRRDSHGRTALHWACSSGQTEIVRLLLALGAEVACYRRSYDTPTLCVCI